MWSSAKTDGPVSKPITILGILAEALGIYFNTKSDKYIKLMFDNANTGYDEVRAVGDILFYFTRRRK